MWPTASAAALQQDSRQAGKMFNLTVFLLLNGFCYLCRPDRRRGECQSHGHLGGEHSGSLLGWDN